MSEELENPSPLPETIKKKEKKESTGPKKKFSRTFMVSDINACPFCKATEGKECLSCDSTGYVLFLRKSNNFKLIVYESND